MNCGVREEVESMRILQESLQRFYSKSRHLMIAFHAIEACLFSPAIIIDERDS